MSRTQTACFALLASAFVLAAMLVAGITRHADTTANADVVITKNVYTFLSANGVNTGEDFIYLLDNKNERLLCYWHNPRGRIELYGTLDVANDIQAFIKTLEKRGGDRRTR
jgi:hypothetical protein